MLRLGRPVGAYPRLEARLAALHLGGGGVAAEEEPAVEDTGCAECGGKKAEYKDDCTSSEGEPDHDTSSSDDDCGCVTGKEFEKNAFFDQKWDTVHN